MLAANCSTSKMKFFLCLLLVSCVATEVAMAASFAQSLCLAGLRLLNGLSDLGASSVSQQISLTCGQQWWSYKLGPVCKIAFTDNLGKGISASFGQCTCGASGNTCDANPTYCTGPTALNGLCKLQASNLLSACASMTIYTCSSPATTTTSTTTTTTTTTASTTTEDQSSTLQPF